MGAANSTFPQMRGTAVFMAAVATVVVLFFLLQAEERPSNKLIPSRPDSANQSDRVTPVSVPETASDRGELPVVSSKLRVVRVVDSDNSRKPIGAANLVCYPQGVAFKGKSHAVSSVNGEALVPDAAVMLVIASGSGYSSRVLRLERDEPEIQLHLAGSIEVVLSHADGSPASGVEAVLLPKAREPWRRGWRRKAILLHEARGGLRPPWLSVSEASQETPGAWEVEQAVVRHRSWTQQMSRFGIHGDALESLALLPSVGVSDSAGRIEFSGIPRASGYHVALVNRKYEACSPALLQDDHRSNMADDVHHALSGPMNLSSTVASAVCRMTLFRVTVVRGGIPALGHTVAPSFLFSEIRHKQPSTSRQGSKVLEWARESAIRVDARGDFAILGLKPGEDKRLDVGWIDASGDIVVIHHVFDLRPGEEVDLGDIYPLGSRASLTIEINDSAVIHRNELRGSLEKKQIRMRLVYMDMPSSLQRGFPLDMRLGDSVEIRGLPQGSIHCRAVNPGSLCGLSSKWSVVGSSTQKKFESAASATMVMELAFMETRNVRLVVKIAVPIRGLMGEGTLTRVGAQQGESLRFYGSGENPHSIAEARAQMTPSEVYRMVGRFSGKESSSYFVDELIRTPQGDVHEIRLAAQAAATAILKISDLNGFNLSGCYCEIRPTPEGTQARSSEPLFAKRVVGQKVLIVPGLKPGASYDISGKIRGRFVAPDITGAGVPVVIRSHGVKDG